MAFQHSASIGDYYHLASDHNRDKRPIEHYGILRMYYLKNYRLILYSNLLINAKLHDHLAMLNIQAREHKEMPIRLMRVVKDVIRMSK